MKLCGECTLWHLNNGLCPIFRMNLDASEQGCPAFTSHNNIKTCEACGRSFLTPGTIEIVENQIHLYCDDCTPHLHNCPTCAQSKYCAFEKDPSPTPKTITQTTQRGNAIIQQQVPNPERIREICQAKCSCYSEEFGCLRQFNSCGSWIAPYEVK